MNDRWILGIAGSHNSGVALTHNGEVVVAVQTERLSRVKRQAIRLDCIDADGAKAIAYCLRYAGIDLGDLLAIATSTPWDSIDPKFALPHDILASAILPRFLTVPHHLAHAEYALHYSPMQACLVLVCDGSGTYESQRSQLDVTELVDSRAQQFTVNAGKESISAYTFDGRDLKLVYRVAYGQSDLLGADKRPATGWLSSMGHLWEWCAAYCHGSRHEAGKVMGLAPFGDPTTHVDLDILSLSGDGRVEVRFAPLAERFTMPNRRGADISGTPHYADLAAYLQQSTNDFLSDLVGLIHTRWGKAALCYSGGVALNSVANEHMRRTLGVELHMNGSCEDNGTAIGAALAVDHHLGYPRIAEPVTDYLGREYSDREIVAALRDVTLRVERLHREDLLRRTALAIASGQVVAWFQGRSEFGPRALGNRSILADPRNPEMQDILNRRVKHREAFRPFAPAVKEERAAEFFDIDGPSPMMLRVVPVRGLQLPAITHVDGSARVQTVSRDQNALFYHLLDAFETETGIPILLNTSFNLSGEPIVETPVDAVRSFLAAKMDLLILGNYVVSAG